MPAVIEPKELAAAEVGGIRPEQQQESRACSGASVNAIPWQSLFNYAGSLADQSLVSGTRFLTTILVGSFCGASELGSYALGFSILMALHCLQISLFSRPYTIQGNKVEGDERRELAGSVLVQFVIFGLLATVCLGSIVLAQHLWGLQTVLTPVIAAIAIGAPFILLRDHARQFCFAHTNVKRATVVDGVATVIQLGGIGLLAWQGQLSAASAFVVTALSSGPSGLLWLWLDRHAITIRLSRVFGDFRTQWSIGKWDCASELVATTQIHGMTWLLAFLLDRSSVGIYSACMMAMMLLNPFLLGINTLLVPGTVQRFVADGVSGLQNIVRRTTLLVGSATAIFATGAAIWGASALEFVYRGQGFDIPELVVAVLAFGIVAEVFGMGPENGLWAMERHDFNFRVGLVGGVVTLVSALALISTLGLAGAALSFTVGRLVTTIAHWIAYRTAIRGLSAAAER